MSLTRFDDGFPELLKRIGVPPVALYFKGNTACLNDKAVAVVGTRNPSPYGEKIGKRLGTVVAERCFVVVSRLADGCDSAGHKGCVAVSRPIVAIMGTSFDEIYLKSNRQLAEDILSAGGCLMTEYPL